MLYEHVEAARIRRLSIIGLAKHAGKTTAMNTIVEEATLAGAAPLSLQSIGVDGERFDALIGVPKPSVQAPAGTLLATAADALEQGTARLEILEAAGIPSPMGEIFIARVAEEGSVLLAGIRQVTYAAQLFERLEKWGPRLQIIDGAFDRMACATPDLVDGIVLCTGAAVGRNATQVVNQTQAALSRLRIPAIMQGWERELASLARTTGCAVAGGPQLPPQVLNSGSPFLSHPKIGADWPEKATAIALPGSVTDRMLGMLEGSVEHLILKDGTHMMGSIEQWRRFARKGGRISVERPILVAAITVNSVSVEGYRLPRRELIEGIRMVAAGVPVVDCLYGEAAL